ncbi:hypothetical protein [Planktomarina temperata]|uniref:Serralysin-like metalloprotease n=1 Tax=Planktomarina temperata RCA23 TaxID=666509 RepID=A0AAN0VHP0_9RHOB|nr:putative serralysin-like metalloprotease [Planktomarina temperata RCA23]
MSSEEIAAVEKNGNYWLSASNTAYHIINPNATSLKPIESDGYYSLARGGDTFYVLDASGNSIKLDLNGRTMFDDFTGVVSQAGSTNTYTPTHVEESPFVWYWEDKILGPHPDAAFLVLASRNDVSASWDTSSFHNNNIWGFFFDETGTYQGQSDVIKLAWFPDALQRPGSQYESLFGDDLNNDGLITPGASPTNLLNISGNQHHIDDGHGGESVILKNDNVIIGPNSNAGWSATQVEKNGGHLEVLWKHPTGNKYDVWQVDTSGNFVSSIKTKLWEDELKFNQDLNGDGDTGLVTVEAIGNAHLKHGDNTINGAPQYYIVDGSNDPIGLTNGGQKGPTSYAGWSATQVIASESGGYEVLWSHTGGKHDVWKVDTSGNFESSIKANLWEDELKFGVDINLDGIDSGKKNNIYGSVGNDTFDGGAGDDIINGREGHDTLIGGEGNDWLSGDGGSGYAGNDILFGNAGNDDLRGRDGNDQIDGGTGNDQIDGGTGSDTIITGTGSDTIILRIGDGGNTSSNADIITDFTDGSDNFGLDDGLLFSQLVIVQGSGAYASDTIISKGSEYLAILQGIDATLLSDADFETVDIA